MCMAVGRPAAFEARMKLESCEASGQCLAEVCLSCSYYLRWVKAVVREAGQHKLGRAVANASQRAEGELLADVTSWNPKASFEGLGGGGCTLDDGDVGQ